MLRLVLTVMVTIAALASGSAAAGAAEPAPAPGGNVSGLMDAADAEAPLSAFTAPGVDDPQCMGANFVSAGTDISAAEKLLHGYVTIATFKEWRLPVNSAGHVDLAKLTWREDPFNNNSWVFQINTLRWIDPLRRVGLGSGPEVSNEDRAAMRALYEGILHDWVRNNPYSEPRSAYAWYDMSVGVRAIGLVCATTVIDEADPANAWLKYTIAAHAKSLLDPKQYRVVGNHALHQNIGLLALGCHTDTAAWKDVATARGTTLLKRSVDSEGVTDEGSILYQGLNYRWYTEFREHLELCGIVPDPAFANIDKMPDMLAQATQPDGTVVAFGDTSAIQKAQSIPGTLAEYAATLGQTGTAPTTPLLSIYQRGYAFSRTGWFDTQPANAQSLAAIRFGVGKNSSVHGHQDAGNVSYFALGKQILWQPGVWGGAGGKPRIYVLSNEAHNTIDIPATTYNSSANTTLSASMSNSDVDLVSIRTGALRGAVWKRTMIHAKLGNFLIVDDQIDQAKSRAVVQSWNYGADRSVKASKSRVDTYGSGTDSVTLWVGAKPKLSVVKGQKSPLLGWRSETANRFIKTPMSRATINGKSVHFTAIIVPRPGDMKASDIRVVGSSKSGATRTVDVKVGAAVYRVKFTNSSASVTLR